MGTLGIQPPQFNIPGNLKNLPKGLTSNLDPNKLKQLSPAQLEAIKNLPPEKLASLNNIPIDQLKKLDPSKLKDFTSKLPNSNEVKNKLDKTKNAVKKRIDEQKKKADDFKKSLDDKKEFLKDQVKQTTKNAKNIIIGILTPVLLSFIRAENIADLLIKKITRDTKKQLQNKGTLTIDNGVFTFTPSNPGNYTVFKNNFDRRVSNLKQTISTLQNIVNTLTNVIKVLNISLSALKLYVKFKLRATQAKKKALETSIRAVVPPAPVPGALIVELNAIDNQLNPDVRGTIANTNKKIETYQAGITAAQLFLTIFKEMLAKIKTKIDRLQFNVIIDDAPTIPDVINFESLLDPNGSTPTEEEYINNNGKSYILRLVTLPNEQRQYQALDSFSKLKITQTAPSRIKTNAQLLEEIKQILG